MRRALHRLFVENFWWKLFSVFLAAALWVSLVGETERSATIRADIQYKNFPSDLEISSDPVERVYLKVHGPASRLTEQSLSQSAVVLDLASVVNPREQTFTLGPSNVSLPQQVTLERVVPSQIQLRFEHVVTRDVPVVIRYAGSPPAGYRVVTAEVTPHTIRITGPESHVQHVNTVESDPVDLTGKVGAATYQVATYIADSQVRMAGPSMVSVRVKLEKAGSR